MRLGKFFPTDMWGDYSRSVARAETATAPWKMTARNVWWCGQCHWRNRAKVLQCTNCKTTRTKVAGASQGGREL